MERRNFLKEAQDRYTVVKLERCSDDFLLPFLVLAPDGTAHVKNDAAIDWIELNTSQRIPHRYQCNGQHWVFRFAGPTKPNISHVQYELQLDVHRDLSGDATRTDHVATYVYQAKEEAWFRVSYIIEEGDSDALLEATYGLPRFSYSDHAAKTKTRIGLESHLETRVDAVPFVFLKTPDGHVYIKNYDRWGYETVELNQTLTVRANYRDTYSVKLTPHPNEIEPIEADLQVDIRASHSNQLVEVPVTFLYRAKEYAWYKVTYRPNPAPDRHDNQLTTEAFDIDAYIKQHRTTYQVEKLEEPPEETLELRPDGTVELKTPSIPLPLLLKTGEEVKEDGKRYLWNPIDTGSQLEVWRDDPSWPEPDSIFNFKYKDHSWYQVFIKVRHTPFNYRAWARQKKFVYTKKAATKFPRGFAFSSTGEVTSTQLADSRGKEYDNHFRERENFEVTDSEGKLYSFRYFVLGSGKRLEMWYHEDEMDLS